MIRRTRLLAGLGLALLLPAGCSGGAEPVAVPTPAPSVSATSTPTEWPREGPSAAWSIPFEEQNGTVARVGDVVVVHGDGLLRGLSWSTGAQVWRRPHRPGASWSVTAGGTLALTTSAGGDRELFEVVDAATGRTRWRTPSSVLDVTVFADVAYLFDCTTTCTVTSRDIRAGGTRWRTQIRSRTSGVEAFAAIGQTGVNAPAVGRFVPLRLSKEEGPDDRRRGALDVRTGRPTGARFPESSWYSLVVGDSYLILDSEPEGGAASCKVAIQAYDVRTGAVRWNATVHSGRAADNSCVKALGTLRDETSLFGAGSRIAAVDPRGRPQLFDLATHKSVWAGPEPGLPVAAGQRSVLVRRRLDAGPLSLLDARNGRRLWTAPDPGGDWSIIRRNAVVGSRFVVVTGTVKEPGSASTAPVVIAYDVATGRQLARYRGWLAGVGDGWLALKHVDANLEDKLDLIKL